MKLNSYQLNAKINRAMKQKIFLLKAEYIKNEWFFQVQGTSGNIYNVKLTSKKQTCSCPDFIQRKNVCKHIIFIIGRVAQSLENLRKLKETECNIFEIVPDLNEKLNKRLSKRLNESEKTINLDDDCIICFEKLGVVSVKETCKVCNISYHKKCLHTWLKRKKCCAHCRTDWKTSNDELECFNEFNVFFAP